MSKLLLIIANIHGSTRKHIRRTHKHRETDLGNEFVHIIHSRKLTPLRLIHTQSIHNAGELVPVLSLVNVASLGSENRHTALVKPESQVVRNLSTHGNDHSMRSFKFDDIHYPLEGKLIEI